MVWRDLSACTTGLQHQKLIIITDFSKGRTIQVLSHHDCFVPLFFCLTESEGYHIPLKALGQVSGALGDLDLSHYGVKLWLSAVLDYTHTHAHTHRCDPYTSFCFSCQWVSYITRAHGITLQCIISLWHDHTRGCLEQKHNITSVVYRTNYVTLLKRGKCCDE